MAGTKKRKEFARDTEYNKRLIKVGENYLALLKVQLKQDLDNFKQGAWNIARSSKNPKLKKVCEQLDKLEIK